MKLKKTYIVGVHVMFYEVEMFKDYIDSCIQMMDSVENRDNVLFHFTFNVSEYFETINRKLVSPSDLIDKFQEQLDRLRYRNINLLWELKGNNEPIYNIPAYRRDLNYKYCLEYDFILWGETDSLWAANTFQVIETINNYAITLNIHRFIINFGYRKMWDNSWKPTEHLKFKNTEFKKDKEWQQNNPASPKSYMSLEEMNKINEKYNDKFVFDILNNPKFDGSCLVISSELIKSGVNIPHALLLCGEDESFARIAKTIMGNQYKQFSVKSVLRVHNRRHPKKRMYIANENNIKGYCDQKGNWWNLIEKLSKRNLNDLFQKQNKFFTYSDWKKKLEGE